MNTQTNEINELETMILMSLDLDKVMQNDTSPEHLKANKKIDKMQVDFVDPGRFLKFRRMEPKSAYTVDLNGNDRLYGITGEYLMQHPADILGDEAEILLMDKDTLKWSGYRRTTHKPKGVAASGKVYCWYEHHYMQINSIGEMHYQQRMIPFNKKGGILFANVRGEDLCDEYVASEAFLACGIIEDAYRSNAMLATISDATEIKFPVPLNDYVELFFVRNNPLTETGRKRPIIHWVAEHLRKKSNNDYTSVKKHTRGIKDFHINGMLFNIQPNTGIIK